MNYHNNYNLRFVTGFTAAVLILGGCAARGPEPERVCPKRETAVELLGLLSQRLESAVPLKASGRCIFRYYNKDDKFKKENFPVKLWMNPPVEIYMQGDVAFNPKGIVLGSSEEEFWLAIKPKEVSGYWWGRWSGNNHLEKLKISPKLMLEALGIMVAGDEEDWSLSRDEGFEVLARKKDGIVTKKIYLNSCDYLVKKIEYIRKDGETSVVMELGNYEQITEVFFVPGVIKITSSSDRRRKDSVKISFSSVEPVDFTDKQRGRLFTRPEPRGFKNIYEIVDGNFVEQSQ